MARLADALGQVRTLTFLRYLFSSVVALIADIALFLQLISLHLSPAIASSLSYSLGIVVHWIISSRLVFIARVANWGAGRVSQQAQFVGSALFGLMTTTIVVACGTSLGLQPPLAKAVAVVISFAAVWHLRNRYIFRAER